MTGQDNDTFGALLRRFRLAAGLTQEALAERAGVSAAAVAALERGRRTSPHPATVALLVDALGLSDERRASLVAATLQPASPAATPSSHLPSLPVPPTALIGRESDEAFVLRLLQHADSPARLLTLTGPGGVGKTRLALAVAAAAWEAYPDGVVFVDLSALHESALLATAIARALDVRELGSQHIQEALAGYLRERRLLLVLDNFEHMVGAAPLVAELIARCPHLAVLVTSRTALRMRGEQQVRVPPLATPPTDAPPTADDLTRYAAVRLFVERARAVRGDFHLDDDSAAAVAEICRRLDGLPLAIELAAARVGLLPPRTLCARLERRLAVLTGGPRDLPARQQTLRATIDWSHSLLSSAEQIVFRRLAVFVGAATLEAVEAICGQVAGTSAWHSDDMLTTLSGLVDKSLLREDDDARDEPRVSLLETVREYGLERLEASGEGEAMRRAHAAYYLGLAEEAAPGHAGAERSGWLAFMEREHHNLRAALGWAWEREQGEIGLRLAGALWPFWHSRGHLSEGRAWLERLLTVARRRGGVAPMCMAEALTGAAWLAQAQDDYTAATPLLEESAALRESAGHANGLTDLLVNRALQARAEGDYGHAVTLLTESLAAHRAGGNRESIGRRGLGLSLFRLGMVLREQGDCARAMPLYEECLSLHRGLHDREGIAIALLGLGDIARDEGDAERVRVYCEESCALFEALGNQWGMGFSLNNLALGAYGEGDLDRAAALAARSVAIFRDLGVEPNIAEALTTLGRIIAAQGDGPRARAALSEALALAQARGPRYLIPAALEALADLACTAGQTTAAARLLAAAETLRSTIGAALPAFFRPAYERTLATVRAALGDEALAAAWEAGREMLPDQALASLDLSLLDRPVASVEGS